MTDDTKKNDGNKRTATARRNDDSEVIDNAEEQGGVAQQGRAGGNLERAVGTRDERKRLDDPETSTKVTKSNEKGMKGFSPNEVPGSG